VNHAEPADVSDVDYPSPGSSAQPPAHWPAGYRRLHVSTRLGSGDAAFAAAARAVMEWRLHRAVGVIMDAEHGAARAEPGVRVTVGLGVGPLRVYGPCRVVWTVWEPGRCAGWAYGTLPGHPVRGEEAFVVTRDTGGGDGTGPEGEGGTGGGTVRLEVRAFSVPAVWWSRAAGPLGPLFQHAYAHRCGSVLRRLVRRV
jgi:uncharacterized protein (UPF0548 family)